MTDTDEREDATASAPSDPTPTTRAPRTRVPLTWRASAPSRS